MSDPSPSKAAFAHFPSSGVHLFRPELGLLRGRWLALCCWHTHAHPPSSPISGNIPTLAIPSSLPLFLPPPVALSSFGPCQVSLVPFPTLCPPRALSATLAAQTSTQLDRAPQLEHAISPCLFPAVPPTTHNLHFPSASRRPLAGRTSSVCLEILRNEASTNLRDPERYLIPWLAIQPNSKGYVPFHRLPLRAASCLPSYVFPTSSSLEAVFLGDCIMRHSAAEAVGVNHHFKDEQPPLF